MSKLAVVTGAARGIGRAVTYRLLLDGLSVAALDVDRRELDALRTDSGSDRLSVFCANVSYYEAVKTVFETINDQFGRVSVLVNNAGIQTHRLVTEMTEEDWDETIRVNLKSVFLCTKQAIRGMQAQRWGRIINISSMSAVRGSSKHAHYCASKAGVVGFTKAVALEAGIYGITCNAVCPGIVDTRMIEQTMNEKHEKWMEEMPVKRFGRPDDIADTVAFLASDKAEWITGQAIHVNGGIITP